MRFTSLLAAVFTTAVSASPFMHIGIPVSSINSNVAATSTLAAVVPSSALSSATATGSGAPRYIPGTNLPWPHPRIPIHHNDLFQSVDIQGMGDAVPSTSTSAEVNVALATAAPTTPKVVRTFGISNLGEQSFQATDASVQPEMSIQIIDPVPEASVQTLSTLTAPSEADTSSDATVASGDSATDEATVDNTEDSDESSEESSTDESTEDNAEDSTEDSQ